MSSSDYAIFRQTEKQTTNKPLIDKVKLSEKFSQCEKLNTN